MKNFYQNTIENIKKNYEDLEKVSQKKTIDWKSFLFGAILGGIVIFAVMIICYFLANE